MPRTILFVADDPAGGGGTEKRLLKTVKGLPPERWRPIVVVPAKGPLHSMLQRAGVDTRIINFYRIPRLWRLRRYLPVDSWMAVLVNGWRLKRLIDREGVLLLHSMAKETFNVRNLGIIAGAADVPLVWSCGDTNPKVLTYCRKGLGDRLARLLAVSNHVREALLGSGIGCQEKIETLYNAINLDEWDKETALAKTPFRDEIGVPEGQPIVALVGRLDRVKGQSSFLAAAETVAKSHPKAFFLLVGVTPPSSRLAPFADYYREVEALARRPALRGRVFLTGWRSDTARVMASIDILVQPSLRETFGQVLIEAMASRKPVIATRVGGMPEIVIDRVTGLIVPPEEPGALAEAISTLLKDPARRMSMGEAGRRRVEACFSLREHIRRLESIYSDVLYG